MPQRHALERQFESALAKRRVELNYEMHEGVVHFERVVIARHRLLKARLLNYVMGARLTMILSAPAIYALIIPLALLDLFIGFYQTACFPVYGIPRVRRRDYLAFDRGQLAYLNAIENLTASTARMPTASWRTCARSRTVLRSCGVPSSTLVAYSVHIPAMAGLWTLATATRIGTIWSDFGLKRSGRN